jgi:hypothetical protein
MGAFFAPPGETRAAQKTGLSLQVLTNRFAVCSGISVQSLAQKTQP